MAVFLFLLPICLLFFIPVQFRLYYQRVDEDDYLLFEMSFLGGLLKRSWEASLLQLAMNGVKRKITKKGRWFGFKEKASGDEINPLFGNNSSRGWGEFFHRYYHFGLGMTLLTYFLPAKYQNWLLVVDRLENRGKFYRLVWKTHLGTGDGALDAYCYGILWAIKAALIASLSNQYRFARIPEISVMSDFQTLRFDTVFDCIFRVKLGYIIIAAFITRLRYRLAKGGVSIE